MSTQSIRTQIIPLIGLILILGFLATNVVSYLVSSHAIRSALVEHELPLTGSNIYSEVQTDLVRPILVSSLMANDTFVLDWLAGGEKDADAITRYLKRIREEYGAFTSFLISRSSQVYYHFEAAPRLVDPKDPTDAWFFRLIDDTKPYEINVDVNKAQNNAVTVFINYRVVDAEGKLLAVTGVGLDFSAVSNIVARYRSEFDRNIYFVDGKGNIVVATAVETPVGSNIATSEGLSGIASQILSEDHGDYSFSRAGHTVLLSQRLIPDLGWRVFVEQDEGTALRPLWLGFLTNLGIGLAIIAATVVVVALAFGVYQRRLEQLVFTDRLTGIGNRRQMETELDAVAAHRDLLKNPVSLITLDLLRFHEINETYGHPRGDQVLRHVGQLLQELATDALVVSRMGGDEFAILWDGPLTSAERFAGRLLKVVIEDRFLDPDGELRLHACLGVAGLMPGDGRSGVIDRTARALRRAKDSGGDRVVSL
ncbi:sensor domain-containing diguanylate cyclase [Oryzibacter oryziterrae]|uniref:sensor domain-containing diguanylate cyclase n=1 Tax=Oryzibacter oryziterrae TaxID=2766474 RepID=UPI001F1BA209|nr:sensor domain-containing diguanylate cyclase [Oryzibacter oryziterrae]